MSTYYQYTKHPRTGRWEKACWIDDHYGRHHYGCRFPNGDTFDPWQQPLKTADLDDGEAAILNGTLDSPSNV